MQLEVQRECGAAFDDLLNVEKYQAFCSGDVCNFVSIPINFGASGEMYDRAALEVQKNQPCPWIRRQIAQRIEHIVTAVVRKDQPVICPHMDEAGGAAAMRGIRAAFGMVAG